MKLWGSYEFKLVGLGSSAITLERTHFKTKGFTMVINKLNQ
jgi:hypothetical protein